MTRPAERATDREVGVVAAVLVAGSEKAAEHRLGLSHSTVKHHLANARTKVGATTAQLVWILARGCPSPTAWPKRTSSGLLDEVVGLPDLTPWNLRHRRDAGRRTIVGTRSLLPR